MAMFNHEQLHNDKGVARTKSLIVDFGANPDNILCLHDTSKPFPALRSLFLKMVADDPTEAVFALAVFGSVEFWEKLQKSHALKPYLKKWRHEADVARKSVAFQYIVKEVEEDGKNAFQAAKYIISEPWKPRTKESKEDSLVSTKEAAPSHILDLAEEIRKRRNL